MQRFTFLGVLSFTLILLVLAVFVLPGRKGSEPVNLPWQISVSPQDGLQVFGLELGRTTLGEAELAFAEPVVVSLFANDKGEKVIEGYFNNVTISGLRARIVMVMALSEEQVGEIHSRGVRVANIGGGRHKVTLTDSDMELVKSSPISVLTYLPKLNLDAELITARFGEPAERIKEKGSQIEHWLYPQKGLDIALDPEGKDVLQYVQPKHFEKLRGPLVAGVVSRPSL